uniref:Uncharacterized protein n=1 Tax=Knipowitschia caucasica TaxID=637954 RepID=A0AAV2JQT1_KNICA
MWLEANNANDKSGIAKINSLTASLFLAALALACVIQTLRSSAYTARAVEEIRTRPSEPEPPTQVFTAHGHSSQVLPMAPGRLPQLLVLRKAMGWTLLQDYCTANKANVANKGQHIHGASPPQRLS